MKFNKQDLRRAVYDDHDDFFTIEENIIDTTRWSVVYDWTFQYDGKFYSTTYSVGATECQDERPFENDPDEIECDEVFPVQITITQYVTASVRDSLANQQ